MNRYTELTTEEKLSLSDSELYDSIKVEAVMRGIKIPVSVADIAGQVGTWGFHIPAEHQELWEILLPNSYGSNMEKSGLCFRTEEEAKRAIEGGVRITHESYPYQHIKIINGDLSYGKVFLTLVKQETLAAKVVEYENDRQEDFDKLVEELMQNYRELRQEAYNTEVRKRKRKEYLELAKGDLEIAKAFWARAESGDFPSE